MKGKVLHGDCIEVMQSLEEDSIDALVSDPPYGISFMGKTWDKYTPKAFQEFSYDWATEALRVLKPGGYVLAFSGTRTYHRMVCGIEDAGFVIKDQMAWMYGSGFPKSLNISLAINKHLGGEVEQGNVKIDIDGKPRTARVPNDWNLFDDKQVKYNAYEKIPTHPEALKWQGWYTALKPAWEPIVVAQKPFKTTYAENVLEYGVGGINIDASRVGYSPNKETDSRITNQEANVSRGKHTETGNVNFAPDGNGMEMYKQNKGRYPSNVLLSHHAECVVVGTKSVKTSTLLKKHNVSYPKYDAFSYIHNERIISHDYGKNGTEEVAAYDCHPDCPVRLLDEQSGVLKSGGKIGKKYKRNDIENNTFESWNDYTNTMICDKGGASRFFKTFNGKTRFIYNGKAHKSERNAGLEGIIPQKRADINKMMGESGNFKTGSGNDRTTEFKNNIATLKPINVMRYLVRLVCPKGGTVLDPFGGSGTTAIACIIEGLNYITIEKRERFAKVIIPKRLEWWSNPDNWSVLKDHNALPKIKMLKNKKQNKGIERWLT